MQIVRKLTIKTCGDFTIQKIRKTLQDVAGYDGDKQKDIPDGTTVDILKIAGESTSATTGQTDKGSFTKLGGSFIGTDMTTGELYQSGVCILPDFIGSQLGAAILQSKSSVQFAFLIQAKAKANAVTGYEFAIKPLMESKPTDAMQRIMALAGIEAKAKPEALPDESKKAEDHAPVPAVAPAAPVKSTKK
jgi:hypothetical protein